MTQTIKRKPGRQFKDPADRQSEYVAIRLTPGEHARLAAVLALGVSARELLMAAVEDVEKSQKTS